jgi:hypothetical protein
MRRLLRWTFSVSALLSAAAFVVVCMLWVRGYWIEDHFGRVRLASYGSDIAERRTGLFSGGGRITYASSTEAGYTPAEWARRRVSPAPADGRFGWSSGDFVEF